MSVFGSLLTLQDAINRLPQFEYQITRLEKDHETVKSQNSRSSFRRNLERQCQELQNQLSEHRKRTENTRTEEIYKKETALEQIDNLQQRLAILLPSPESEKPVEVVKKPTLERRKNTMYNDSDEESDNEIIETEIHLDEDPEPVPPAPQPKPRRTEPDDTIARLQNPTRGDDPEIMDPVIVSGNVFMAIDDWPPEADGDLELVKGKTYRITQTRADGWWTALNEDGRKGLVPKTYLHHVKEKTSKNQSKVSSRLGVRDSVIGITSVTDPSQSKESKKMTKQQNDCLGAAFDSDSHLSSVCHMTPRLSTSNIGFHDLFWSNEKDQIYKRTVHISKIIRLVRFEKMPLIEHKALVRMALVDVTNPRNTQVVSNVHTLVPRVKSSTWFFEKKESQTRSCVEFSDVVLRSNYSSPTVVLVVEASHIIKTQFGLKEKSLGHTYLRLIIDDKAVPSKTNVLYLDDEIMSRMKIPEASKRRVFVQVMDVPKEKVAMVDSQPDVILFNALYLPFFHFYRRRAGTILIRDNRNPLNADFVSDPLLSVFPHISDQHDVMDALLKIWNSKKKLLSKKTEADQTAEFFQTFLHSAFFIHGINIISYDVKDEMVLSRRQEMIQPIYEALQKGIFKQFIITQKFHPVNIHDYSLDLLGTHSID